MAETQPTQATAEESRVQNGTFCWWDLATTDAEAAKTFYSGLFGWTSFDVPMGESGNYTMLQFNGKEVGGLSMRPELEQQGAPPHWSSYIDVEDVDRVIEQAKSLGAQVIAEPFDVMDQGRMAVIADPTGAVVCFWQSTKPGGGPHRNAVGGVSWNELATRDAAKAGEFYSKLLGWEVTHTDAAGMPYTMFTIGETQVGGMMQMTDEWGPEIPPHWMQYFWVADCDATVKKATELGGTVKVPPMDIPTVGRFAVLVDPQGAHFSVIAFVEQ
jgi:predicted enzyme related to lactoylglutathione lyase